MSKQINYQAILKEMVETSIKESKNYWFEFRDNGFWIERPGHICGELHQTNGKLGSILFLETPADVRVFQTIKSGYESWISRKKSEERALRIGTIFRELSTELYYGLNMRLILLENPSDQRLEILEDIIRECRRKRNAN